MVRSLWSTLPKVISTLRRRASNPVETHLVIEHTAPDAVIFNGELLLLRRDSFQRQRMFVNIGWCGMPVISCRSHDVAIGP